MTAFPGHLAIAASAGTGKTFQLAHRFIHLLMLGESPERMVALTFSRKAAREIFDRVIGYLAEAAVSDEAAEHRNQRLGLSGVTASDYRVALRRLLEKLPRSRVGTIDSFIVGVIRAFPYELGLEPDFQVFDGDGVEAQWCRRDALRVVLQSAVTREEDRAQFFEAFKLATFGHEEKRSGRILNEVVTEYQGLYRLQSDSRRWGLAVDQTRSTCADIAEWQSVIQSFRKLLANSEWSSGTIDYWEEFCDELLVWRPERDITKRMDYVLSRLPNPVSSMEKNACLMKFNRDEFTLPVPMGRLLVKIVHFIGDEALRHYTIRTLGMFRLIERCEDVYDHHVRQRGFLTFEDALFALRNQTLSSDISGEEKPNRIAIDYRLDAKLDHWLLDEFQDTSTMQWQVLSNLVDEVVQDAAKNRTLFYVGDIKQAIYGWRGGNAALFNEILHHYNRSQPDVIECRPLDKSFRSSRPIIDTVNRVFGNLSSRLDAGVRREWAEGWNDHDCDEAVVPKTGYAALIEHAKPGRDDEQSADEERYATVIAIIEKIDPIARGLTVGVLCRSNPSARRMAESLRAAHPHMPVVLEGSVHISDNPAVSLLLSVLQWAEHPGDRFAQRHIMLSPLAGKMPETPRPILASIQNHGFHATLTSWSDTLQSLVALSPYEVMRVGQLLDLAAQMDRESSRVIDRFVELVRQATVEDAAQDKAIRIMTIHKSKGLDFDIVILPDLQGRGGGGSEPLINWSEDRTEPEWILHYMRKQYVALDARLMACNEREELRAGMEDLCVLYVSMTRAASAMYMITTAQGEKSTALNHAHVITDALSRGGGTAFAIDDQALDGTLLYEAGDRAWFKHHPQMESLPRVVEPPREAPVVFQLTSEPRSIPSSGGEFERDAGQLFQSSMRERREIGTAVHEVFEKIDWVDDVQRIEAQVLSRCTEEVAAHVKANLQNPEIANWFKRPVESVEVWREQAFEVILDGQWISGVFDRVVIYRNASGQAGRADIMDFKTNRIVSKEKFSELIEHYRPQLETYQRVLHQLTGIAAADVRCVLIFTDIQQAVVLNHAP